MHFWMICIDVSNASNLSSNLAFQTFQQLMDGAFCCHLHCNITRPSLSFYTTALPGTSLLLILELSLVVHYKKVISALKMSLGHTDFHIFMPLLC
jgi:hypothetical protein